MAAFPPPGAPEQLTVALISDVFFSADGAERLAARLREARTAGAELAVLPEIPLNAWVPAHREPSDADAEELGGLRTRAQQAAARAAGIGLVGGVIARDTATGRRFNTALVIAPDGRILGTYRKLHLPEEPGFWETSHYEPADDPPRVIEGFALPLGAQICSDVNRPEMSHLLGAAGAELIAAPRATESGTFDRWRIVLRANALTSAAFVVSANRPAPEEGVPLGGPSIAVGPDGQVLLETLETVAIVSLEREAIRRARVDYPGYLPVRARLYAAAWSELARRDG
ncbi:MAG: hypothetical protein A2X23_01400 [Chloroflexi bacterium GWC2_73_18]|nr:MAG: hypothetical protein A2X23_01400 [Chloroflexi bacterium GWC2_73_18]